MAKDIRGLTTLSTGGSTFNRDSDQAPFILAEDVRAGGIANYTDAERNAIDGRVLDNNMLIYNTTSNQYQRYTGGTRNASGIMSGGSWSEFSSGSGGGGGDSYSAGEGINISSDSEISVDTDFVRMRIDSEIDFAYVEGLIGNPNTLVTDAIYRKRLTRPDSEGQIQYLDSDGNNVSSIPAARQLKVRPLNALHRTILGRMHAGSRVIVSLVGSPANAFYATVTGVTMPIANDSDSENFTLHFNGSSASIHFANGSVSEGDRAEFYLKPASRDIITGIDITPRSIAHTHILPGVLTPDLLNDGGATPTPGQMVSVNSGATEFAYYSAFDSDRAGPVPPPGDSDSINYYLGGDAQWHHVNNASYVVKQRHYNLSYQRNYDTDVGWNTGDLAFVSGREFAPGGMDMVHYDNVGNDSDILITSNDSDYIKQIRQEFLIVGREVSQGNASGFLIQAVSGFINNLDSNFGGYRITGNQNFDGTVYANHNAPFFIQDSAFQPGVYEYIGGTQNNNNRTVDGDWRRVSSDNDYFGIRYFNNRVVLVDSFGSEVSFDTFNRNYAGVVQSPGDSDDSDHYLAGDGEWHNLREYIQDNETHGFTVVQVGSNILQADSRTDTLTLAAGNNITLTANPSTDTVTFAATGGIAGDADSDSDIRSISNTVSGTSLTTTLTTYSGRNIASTPVTLPSGGGGSGDTDGKITSAAFTGNLEKTLTLTRADGNSITASFTDRAADSEGVAVDYDLESARGSISLTHLDTDAMLQRDTVYVRDQPAINEIQRISWTGTRSNIVSDTDTEVLRITLDSEFSSGQGIQAIDTDTDLFRSNGLTGTGTITVSGILEGDEQYRANSQSNFIEATIRIQGFDSLPTVWFTSAGQVTPIGKSGVTYSSNFARLIDTEYTITANDTGRQATGVISFSGTNENPIATITVNSQSNPSAPVGGLFIRNRDTDQGNSYAVSITPFNQTPFYIGAFIPGTRASWSFNPDTTNLVYDTEVTTRSFDSEYGPRDALEVMARDITALDSDITWDSDIDSDSGLNPFININLGTQTNIVPSLTITQNGGMNTTPTLQSFHGGGRASSYTIVDHIDSEVTILSHSIRDSDSEDADIVAGAIALALNAHNTGSSHTYNAVVDTDNNRIDVTVNPAGPVGGLIQIRTVHTGGDSDGNLVFTTAEQQQGRNTVSGFLNDSDGVVIDTDGTVSLDTDFVKALNTGSSTNTEALIDVWHGLDTEYNVVKTDPTAAGQIRIGRFNSISNQYTDQTEAGQIFQIRVRPQAGTHTDLLAQMQLGSPVRLIQGNAEWVGALSAAPVVASGLYTFNFSSATVYVTTGNFDTDTEIGFNFRPSVENPVVPGDFIPNAVRSEDINGGEISAFHMQLDSTATANPRAAGTTPISAGTARDAGFAWRRMEDLSVKASLERLEAILAKGIGEDPVKGSRGNLIGRLDYTRWSIDSDGRSINFYTLEQDSELWSGFDDLFDDLLYPTNGLATVKIDLAFQKASTDTDFYDTDIVIETANDGTNQLFEDSEGTNHTKITFALSNNTTSPFAGGTRLIFTDGNGNALTSTPAGKTGGPGYFQHMYAYDSNGRYADLTGQIDEIGIPKYSYTHAPNDYIPFIKDSDSEHIILPLSLGTGLTRSGNTLNSAGGGVSTRFSMTQDGLAPAYEAADTDFAFLSAKGIWIEPPGNISVGTSNTDDTENVSSVFFPFSNVSDIGTRAVNVVTHGARPHTTGLTYDQGELVFSTSDRAQLYAVVANTTNAPALTDTSVFRPISGSGESNVQADWTETNVDSDAYIRNKPGRFDTDSDGFVPMPANDTEARFDRYLAGDGTWREVSHGSNYSVFTDSDAGLVPPSVSRTGVRFLADDGLFKNPHEFIDSDDIINALDFNVQWDTENRELDFFANYQIPAVPGTNGQRAWMILRFTNDPTTNASGTHPLESSAVLTLRARNSDGGLSDFNVRWSSSDVIPGHGTEGQNDVAQIYAQAIGQNFQALGSVVSIGQEGDNGVGFQMANEGPIDTDRDTDDGFIIEFDSAFYNVSADYAQPGPDRGRSGEYQNNTNATGSFHTNGTPAKDSEKIFDVVQVPMVSHNVAGLVAGWDTDVQNAGTDYFLNGLGQWYSGPSNANKGLVPRWPDTDASWRQALFLNANDQFVEPRLSPTEYFHYARNPSIFTGTATSGNVTYVQFSIVRPTGSTTAYTVFYTRSSAGVIQTGIIYPGTLTTPTGTAVATRTYTVSGGSTTWIDS